jgi:cobalt/nickel transport system permease protein
MVSQVSQIPWKKVGICYFALFVWLFTSAMHIPDGYLSPVTSLIMFMLVLPFWILGLKKIRQTMNARSVPLISLMAAFSFVIMMFNIPLPGGTTGHAVGAALAAIVLGPEVAVIAISIALIIQAFFFGDGGVLAIGANCFNMAVVIPYVAFATYRVVSKDTPLQSPRRVIGAVIGGWLGLTVAAFFTAVEFGIQPFFFAMADGTPLYAPYPLSVAIPAMLIPHMLVASVVEGVMTGMIVFYLQRSRIGILQSKELNNETEPEGLLGKLRWLWVGMAVLAVASPLGLLAPGTAWGEWGVEELTKLGLQSVPSGLEKLSTLWGAPFADYEISFLGNMNLGYIFSAILGIFLVGILAWLLTRLVSGGSPEKQQSM